LFINKTHTNLIIKLNPESMKKKLLLKVSCFLLLLTTSLLSATNFFEVNGLRYTVISGTYNVSVSATYTSITGALDIPGTVTNASTPYTVTSIGFGAFSSYTGLTSVTLPNSVTSIGDYAFDSCSGLTSVTIPNNSVTSIGFGAFSSCTGLTSVTLPNSVTSIGNYAFEGCSGLTSVTILNGVTSIGFGAFSSCSGLTSVTLPNSVTSIGNYAFQGCTGLTSVTIPNSVTSIGNSAFLYCSGLTAVNVSWTTPLTIDSSVFSNVTIGNITLTVSSPGVVNNYLAAAIWKDFNLETLSTNSFRQNSKLIVFPNPTSNYITLSGLTKTENYSLYSDLGAKVSVGSVSNNEKINVQNLTNGIYFIKLEGGVNLKFIKK
jgi:hypothetical protein